MVREENIASRPNKEVHNQNQEKNKISENVWGSNSYCSIVSCIAIGRSTTNLIAKKKMNYKPLYTKNEMAMMINIQKGFTKNLDYVSEDVKKELQNFVKKLKEIEGWVPSGTLHAYIKVLLKKGLIYKTNQEGEFNRRKGEGYKYEVNYSKIIEKLGMLFQDKLEEQLELTQKAIYNVDKKIRNVTEEMKQFIAKYAKEKQLLEGTSERGRGLRIKFIDLHYRFSSLKSWLMMFVNFSKSLEELLTESIKITDVEKKRISESLKGFFYFNLLISNKEITLTELLNKFLEHLRTGRIRIFRFRKTHYGAESAYYKYSIPINQKDLFLHKVVMYWRLKDSVLGVC